MLENSSENVAFNKFFTFLFLWHFGCFMSIRNLLFDPPSYRETMKKIWSVLSKFEIKIKKIWNLRKVKTKLALFKEKSSKLAFLFTESQRNKFTFSQIGEKPNASACRCHEVRFFTIGNFEGAVFFFNASCRDWYKTNGAGIRLNVSEIIFLKKNLKFSFTT